MLRWLASWKVISLKANYENCCGSELECRKSSESTFAYINCVCIVCLNFQLSLWNSQGIWNCHRVEASLVKFVLFRKPAWNMENSSTNVCAPHVGIYIGGGVPGNFSLLNQISLPRFFFKIPMINVLAPFPS